MKGKSVFTTSDANAIIDLINQKVVSDKNTQKRLRDKIRDIGFYASDFGIGGGYTVEDFLRVVKIIGSSPVNVHEAAEQTQIAKSSSGRR